MKPFVAVMAAAVASLFIPLAVAPAVASTTLPTALQMHDEPVDISAADETWDIEAALFVKREVPGGLPAAFAAAYDPRALINQLCGDNGSDLCPFAPGSPVGTLDEDDYEEQRASLIPNCQAGSVFVQDYAAYGFYLGTAPGYCHNTKTGERSAPLPKNQSPQRTATSTLDESSAPEFTLFESETPEFDLQEGCLAQLGSPSDAGLTTTQHCAEQPAQQAPESQSDSELPTANADIPTYVVPVAADVESSFDACVLAHPVEVSGEESLCSPAISVETATGTEDSAAAGSNSTGSINSEFIDTTSGHPAAAVAQAHTVAHLFGASAFDATVASSTAPSSAAIAQPLAANALMFINGGFISEIPVTADGLTNLALPALSAGIHEVVVVFSPTNDAADDTAIEIIVDARPVADFESIDSIDAAGAETDATAVSAATEDSANNSVMLVVLGSLLAIAAICALWVVFGGRTAVTTKK